ncbi:MAG: FAD/NAD(P)-binding oxidoreductase [Armatimonadota bacterium]|nr:FAD/NAD(P)-binding oxidoreductase [Armatimonadota bacterium]MDR7493580.1 FAD/NAD(P)-binding oxidoreductase [Armatimonadota bacterium]MDR7547083.1 FAD/NAD(P)-binding oxidoreductase [Armatimonadota bacterium]MDR7552298.1 FAD/NAD(P)-binding oxidoreductase [Armatimonadota bacterium]MDR7556884.1 FAD/NAD(P)-binding oxidoreductase [Armatimonadota bacterium]
MVGGGISGAMCARTLRRLAPDIEVVVLERNPTYVSGPSHVDYVVGLEERARMTVGFEGLVRAGVRIIRSAVTAIRPAENRVVTPQGIVDYTILVVATGMVPADNEIAGLLENAGMNAHAWTWPGALALARAVQSFEGGTFVLSVPPPPSKCPPGPYEVVSLIDEFWKRKGVRAEIVVLDANDRPQPPTMADLWRGVFSERRIAYRPSFKVVEFDPGRRTLVSDRGERQQYTLASVIPPAKAPLFIEESGLDYPFIDADPTTFRSRRHQNIYAVGDVTRTPYPKTAYVGFLGGRNAAYHIARTLGVDRGEPDPVLNQCWPFVSSKEAMFVEVAWTKDGRPIPERTRVLGARPEHVSHRKAWEYGILRAAYG